MEINKAYGYWLYTASIVLLRKLFENLIIDLLRTRYGVKKLELFYNEDKGMHYNLSTLIENLKDNISDFKMFTRAFNDDFFRFIHDLREKAGGSAHSIDISTNSKTLYNWKDAINQYTKLLRSVIQKVKDAP